MHLQSKQKKFNTVTLGKQLQSKQEIQHCHIRHALTIKTEEIQDCHITHAATIKTEEIQHSHIRHAATIKTEEIQHCPLGMQ